MLMLISLIIATDVDIKPHIEEIAEELGWRVMEDVAVESGFMRVDIGSFLRYDRVDYNEDTVQLLYQWVKEMEEKGNKAARELVETLTDLRYTDHRDKVVEVLRSVA
ncbi:unnamed protein product [Merluccius merluccius]